MACGRVCASADKDINGDHTVMPLIVIKRQHPGETLTRTMASVVSVGQYNSAVNDNPVASNADGPADTDCLLQCFVKSKGVRPCVYRVFYRRHKEPQACTVTNKAVFKSLVRPSVSGWPPGCCGVRNDLKRTRANAACLDVGVGYLGVFLSSPSLRPVLRYSGRRCG